MKRSNGYGVRIAAGALGGAAIALGFATFSALTSQAGTGDPAEPAVVEAPPVGLSERSFELLAAPSSARGSEVVQWEDVQLATELAPFEEDREWSGERYLLPGERVALQEEPQQPEREPEPAPEFEVLGTAASAGSGLAVIRIGNGTPQLVGLGQRVEGYEVASIGDGRVTMQNGDRSLSLSVATAAPNGVQSERNRRERQSRDRDDDDDRRRSSAPAARNAGARVTGVMGNAVVRSGAQVQVNGNQVVVTGPNGQQRMILGGPGAAAPAAAPGRGFRFEVAVPADRAR